MICLSHIDFVRLRSLSVPLPHLRKHGTCQDLRTHAPRVLSLSYQVLRLLPDAFVRTLVRVSVAHPHADITQL
jgi:hypothetical protein